MSSIYRLILLCAMVCAVASCGQSAGNGHGHSEAEEHEHESHEAHEGGEAHEEHADEIVFTREQAAAAGLRVETAEPSVFREGIKTSGQILAAQGDEQTLVAQSSGIVSITAQSLVEGAEVEQGSRLFAVSAKTMADGNATSSTQLEYDKAAAQYERAKALAKDKIITQTDLEELKLQMDVKREELKYGHASTAAATTVEAPFKGYVKQLMVRNGEYVTAGTPLCVVTQNKRLQLRADVSERYYSHLDHITGANFRLTGSTETQSIERLGGKLVSYGRSTAKDVCFVPVIFEFDNRGSGIVAGSFCDVYMLGKRREGVISVPISALTEDQGVYYIYIKVDEEGYRKQEVEIGETDGLRREIISGVQPGDKVVVKGTMQVKLAGMSGVIPEGHSH